MIQSTIIVALVALPALAFISWRWVEGIDYMQKNHPDYKGDDFLNWGDDTEENENDKNQIL